MSLEIIQQFEERQKQLEQRLEEQSLLIKEQILQNEYLKRQLGHALTHAQLGRNVPQGTQYAVTGDVLGAGVPGIENSYR